jgi:O-antigen/teichoic acid export membrane protein
MNIWSKLLGSHLFRKGGVYLFSSFLSQSVMFLAWLILPWKLSAEVIGQFALISFLIDLFTKVTVMGMDSALLRFYVDPSQRPRVLTAACGWLGIGGGLATITLALTWNLVPSVLSGLGPIYHDLAWLVLAVALVSAMANIVLAHYVASAKARQFGQLNTLRCLLLAGGYILCTWSGLGLRGLLISQFVASLAIVLFFWLSRSSRSVDAKPLSLDRACLGELYTYGAPMLFYGLFALVSDYSGRLALERQVTLGSMGVFQFYYQIATQVNGIWASLNRAWTPHMFQFLEANRPAACARITRFSFFGTLACAAGLIALMLLGHYGLWHAIIPPAYIERIDLFYLLLLGPLYCCIYTAIYPAFYFEKNTLKIALIQSMISLLTIFLTFYFTIRFKSNGAALSWVLGIFITPFIYVSFFPRIRPQLGPSTAILLWWGGMGGLMSFALLSMHSTPWAGAALLLGMAGTVMLGRGALAAKPALAS